MKFKQYYATQFIFLIFRGFLFLFGQFKFSSIFLRKYFQRKMITGINKGDPQDYPEDKRQVE